MMMMMIIIIIIIATGRPRLHSHQSDAPQYIKALDSASLEYGGDHVCSLYPQKEKNPKIYEWL
jgi:hypothetical protein